MVMRGSRGLSVAGAAALALSAGALVVSNPDPGAFEEFAGRKLAERLSKDLCQQSGFPLLFQLIAQGCERLVMDQQVPLGRLAGRHTRRVNLGVFSLYATELGGQILLPGLRLPRFSVTTLAIAGAFRILETRGESNDPAGDRPRDDAEGQGLASG